MVINGKNLIIKFNGAVIAAAKSCAVEVQTNTMEVSSATDGQWEHSIVGRKAWSFSTDHLVVPSAKTYHKIEALSVSRGSSLSSKVTVDGITDTSQLQSRGVSISAYYLSNGRYVWDDTATYDTYAQPTDAGNRFASAMSNIEDGMIIIITSWDSLSITSAMRTAILNAFTNLEESDIPLMNQLRGAFTLIGRKGQYATCVANLGENMNAHTSLNIDNEGIPLSATPVKDILQQSGNTFDIKMQTEGYVLDVLKGTAICKAANVKSNTSNLLQGSFSFKGTGPLT